MKLDSKSSQIYNWGLGIGDWGLGIGDFHFLVAGAFCVISCLQKVLSAK